METVAEDQPKEKHPKLAIAAVVFLVLYFFFPAILIFPIYCIYGIDPPPGLLNALGVIFYPVIKLQGMIPAYNEFIKWQSHLLGMP